MGCTWNPASVCFCDGKIVLINMSKRAGLFLDGVHAPRAPDGDKKQNKKQNKKQKGESPSSSFNLRRREPRVFPPVLFILSCPDSAAHTQLFTPGGSHSGVRTRVSAFSYSQHPSVHEASSREPVQPQSFLHAPVAGTHTVLPYAKAQNPQMPYSPPRSRARARSHRGPGR